MESFIKHSNNHSVSKRWSTEFPSCLVLKPSVSWLNKYDSTNMTMSLLIKMDYAKMWAIVVHVNE